MSSTISDVFHALPSSPPPAGLDYVGVMRRLFFSANGEYEVTIFILDNSPVEVQEVFEVQLSSDSDLVVFDNFTRTATVEIIDDDRESTSDTCPHAIHSINTLCTILILWLILRTDSEVGGSNGYC